MRPLFVLCFAFLISACPPPAQAPPFDASDAALGADDAFTPVQPEPFDAGPVVVGDLATQACAVLARHHCPEAASVDGGRSCADVFRREDAQGIFDVGTKCVVHAPSVDSLRTDCHVVCRGGL